MGLDLHEAPRAFTTCQNYMAVGLETRFFFFWFSPPNMNRIDYQTWSTYQGEFRAPGGVHHGHQLQVSRLTCGRLRTVELQEIKQQVQPLRTQLDESPNLFQNTCPLESNFVRFQHHLFLCFSSFLCVCWSPVPVHLSRFFRFLVTAAPGTIQVLGRASGKENWALNGEPLGRARPSGASFSTDFTGQLKPVFGPFPTLWRPVGRYWFMLLLVSSIIQSVEMPSKMPGIGVDGSWGSFWNQWM